MRHVRSLKLTLDAGSKQHRGEINSIISGKGGVGKTNLVLNSKAVGKRADRNTRTVVMVRSTAIQAMTGAASEKGADEAAATAEVGEAG